MAALEDWPVEDDFLLRESVEAGAALGAIARGILPFSKPYTREDLTERWRALLYVQEVARPAAKRMAQYIIDAKPRVAPLPVGPDFRDAYIARRAAAAGSAAAKAATATAAAAAAAAAVAAPTDPSPKPEAEAEAGAKAETNAAAAADDAAKRGNTDDAAAVPCTSDAAPSAPSTATAPPAATSAATVADAAGAATDDVDVSTWTLPGFAEAELCVLELPAVPAAAQVDPAVRKRSREALAAALNKIRRLEASAQAATARAATARGALGVLQGSRAEFLITKRETVLGRSTDDQKVDIDLMEEVMDGNENEPFSKVSRQQAFIKLRWNGEFCLRNVGRRPVWINNVAVESGRRCHLAPHSLIEVGNMRLLFLPNPTLVRQSRPEPF